MSNRKQVTVLIATKNYGDRIKRFAHFVESKLNPPGVDIWFPIDAKTMFESLEDIMCYHGVAHNITMIEPLDGDRLLVTYNAIAVNDDKFVIERVNGDWLINYVHNGKTGEKRAKFRLGSFEDVTQFANEILSSED